MAENCKVVATGGLASLFGDGSKYIKAVDEFLTLEGLRIIWERNSKPKEAAAARVSAAPKASEKPLKPWPAKARRS